MAEKQPKLDQPVPQLPVRDVELAQAYYRDILGFEIVWTYPNKFMGAVRRGKVVLFLAQASGEIHPNIHWIFAEDVDASYQEFQKSGARIIEPIENKAWHLRQFALTDLDGHLFYFHHDL